MGELGLPMGVMTVVAGHQVAVIAIFRRLDEVTALLVMGLGVDAVRPEVLFGLILTGW